jgi:pyruvate formate lyase activating enzyme
MEFAHDAGVIARSEGLINIFVSNGYCTPDSVNMMDDFLDCITVDFKGNGETDFLRRYVGVPNAEPIFQTLLEIIDKRRIHVEITDLVVPQIGDKIEEARKLSKWIVENLGPDTPIHFLRFHPDYKLMHLPPTPIETLERHHKVAKEVGLNYAYVGNVLGHRLEHTYCPGCGKIVVRRHGFDITGWCLDDHNRCTNCGYNVSIVGKLSESILESIR